MENFNLKYSLSPEQFKRGMMASGAYKPQRGKQILITLLCLFLMVNSGYAIITTGKFDLINIFYLGIALIAGAYIWLSPYFMLKNIMKNHNESEEIEAEFSEEGLTFKRQEPQLVAYENYNGFLSKDGFLIIYFNRTYEAIPEDAIPEELAEKIKEYLEKLGEKPEEEAPKKDDYDNPEFGIWSPETAKSALEDLDAESEEKTEEKEEGENLSDE